MTQKTTLKKIEEKSFNPLLGSIIGGITGAVIGALITSALQNEDTREKMINMTDQLKDKAIDLLKEANDKPNGIQTVAKKTVNETIDEAGEKYLHN